LTWELLSVHVRVYHVHVSAVGAEFLTACNTSSRGEVASEFVVVGGVRVRARILAVGADSWLESMDTKRRLGRNTGPRIVVAGLSMRATERVCGDYPPVWKSSAHPTHGAPKMPSLFNPSHKMSWILRPSLSQPSRHPEGSVVRSQESCSSSKSSLVAHSCCSCRPPGKVIRNRLGLTILTDFVCRLVRTTDWRLLLGMKLVRPIFLVCGLGYILHVTC
jgi:hypothetical protein